MIYKEKKIFRKMLIVTEYAALKKKRTMTVFGNQDT